jgi:hypothetical protein
MSLLKRKLIFLLLMIFLSSTLKSQMTKKGKLVDIRTASKQVVMNAIAGEYDDEGYRTKTAIKFDKAGNFKMVYIYDKPDEYSKLLRTNIPGTYYKRIISGKYQLYEANYERFNNIGNVQPTNKYGEPIKDNLYVRYYIVLRGTDDRGDYHTMCGEVSQRFDEQYMYGWTISFTRQVNNSDCNCVCETGDAKNREVSLPYIKLR